MVFRKATAKDISAIAEIYENIHTEEEAGRTSIGWIRGIYPTQATAEAALLREDLFVAEEQQKILGAAIINQQQVDVYTDGNWEYPADDSQVMVLHTLVIAPEAMGKGYGPQFVTFYEDYARFQNCCYLRMDTNARNTRARALYKKLGYREIGTVPCVFNGIPGVPLVLLEKKLPL